MGTDIDWNKVDRWAKSNGEIRVGADDQPLFGDEIDTNDEITRLTAENAELKRELSIEKRAHEITIENCLITEKEDAGEISEENIKLHLMGVRYLAEIELKEASAGGAGE